MANYILAIDQSTTTTKAIIFDKNAQVVGRSDVNHAQLYPQRGWVEHNPEEIWSCLVRAVGAVLEKTGESKTDIAALAVTNQRETTMLWDEDGKPVYNAIVWQCSRAEHIVQREEIAANKDYITEATGLQLSPYFSAAKACWIKEHVGQTDKKLYFGTMDTWVIWKLTGKHITDYSNASRTQLFNIHTLKWDEKILSLFHMQDVVMPEVRYSDEIYGTTTVDGIFDTPIPVAGDMGDSHGALFAQQCWKEGMGKCTFGTGGSLMMNIGTTPIQSKNKIGTSIAWGLNGQVEYVFEGTIVCLGDTIKWIVNELGLAENSVATEACAAEVSSSEGVYLVPAFSGLGAPHWCSNARAMIFGLHRYANRNHIVRAALESITYQIMDIVRPMLLDSGVQLGELRVDGGPTNNRLLMQFTADILQTQIIKNAVEELSALGAAYAGGLAVGFWKDREEIAALRQTAEVYRPMMPADEAKVNYDGWCEAVNVLVGHYR